jgi:ABC-type phosphate/phosphonate transport system substrate-binding protein
MISFGFLALLAWIILGKLAPRAAAGGNTSAASPVKIGMVQTFFHDLPKPLIALATEPFKAVMRDTIGLTGELAVGADAFSVARDIEGGKIQYGIFHGFEFAWVQKKHPELKPFMIAVHSEHTVSAYVLVRKEGAPAAFTNLRRKDIGVPKGTKEHCRLYLERTCRCCGNPASRLAPKDYFAHVASPANVETALDELCRGKYDAVLVDSVGLAFYKDLKPGCFNRLHVLTQSEAFLPPVIAYREGTVSSETLATFEAGLRSADRTALGKEMLKMWKITSFEPIPANFARQLEASIKAYPPPEPT